MYRVLNTVRKVAYQDAKVRLIPGPTNSYDSNAIKVESINEVHLGYVPSDMLKISRILQLMNVRLYLLQRGIKHII